MAAAALAKGFLLLSTLFLGLAVASDKKGKGGTPISGPAPGGGQLPQNMLCQAPNGCIIICHDFQPWILAQLTTQWTAPPSGTQYEAVGLSSTPTTTGWGPTATPSIPASQWIMQKLAQGKLVLVAIDGRRELTACNPGEELALCPRSPLLNAVLVEPQQGAAPQPSFGVPTAPALPSAPSLPYSPSPYSPAPSVPTPYAPNPQGNGFPPTGPTGPANYQPSPQGNPPNGDIPGASPWGIPNLGSPTPPPWWPQQIPWPGATAPRAPGQSPNPQAQPPQPQPQGNIPPNSDSPSWGIPNLSSPTPPPGWPSSIPWPGAALPRSPGQSPSPQPGQSPQPQQGSPPNGGQGPSNPPGFPNLNSPTPPPWWPPGLPWPGAAPPQPAPGQPSPAPQPAPQAPQGQQSAPPPWWPSSIPWGGSVPASPPQGWPSYIPWPGAPPGVPTPASPVPTNATVYLGPDGRWRHVIREGDIGSQLAQWYTGDFSRWRELSTTNPELVLVTQNGQAFGFKPWALGQVLVLPTGWDGSKGPAPLVVAYSRKTTAGPERGAQVSGARANVTKSATQVNAGKAPLLRAASKGRD